MRLEKVPFISRYYARWRQRCAEKIRFERFEPAEAVLEACAIEESADVPLARAQRSGARDRMDRKNRGKQFEHEHEHEHEQEQEQE